ncbi:PREDICTED: LOW QUALITY PROTEIN: 39S ribosomal protein L28, mitochondrial-like [Branchiostoma belcheri]|uniref:Large ribosomal subunit protein bL28m n=1 Tax=Branchiostoma belcheri TaxID=7741 RepID=A0A6P4Z2D6_BRABE|nr:PREDICTED: LOW QUALITY PROTEIN: 39S ribosomal protein L28, mitochondrial-like [Branchiostoma belcheri]
MTRGSRIFVSPPSILGLKHYFRYWKWFNRDERKSYRYTPAMISRLPKHYLDSLDPKQPTPVHYKAERGEVENTPKTGERQKVQNIPLPFYPTRQYDTGLWGGEGLIEGFRRRNNDKMKPRVKHMWRPQLIERQLYSEILDKTITTTVTARTLNLIDEAYGFDYYILKTPQEDLNSQLGMDLKRAMLIKLARKDTDLYPTDPEKRDRIYNKYKDYVIPEEEAEWVGLRLKMAVFKMQHEEYKPPVPLMEKYRRQLIADLKDRSIREKVGQEPAVFMPGAGGPQQLETKQEEGSWSSWLKPSKSKGEESPEKTGDR